MNNVANVYNIVTNIKHNGKDLCFAVVADNAKNAIYVANDCKYNGENITDNNIVSITTVMTNVVTSYFTSTDGIKDLNPNYVAPSNVDMDNGK